MGASAPAPVEPPAPLPELISKSGELVVVLEPPPAERKSVTTFCEMVFAPLNPSLADDAENAEASLASPTAPKSVASLATPRPARAAPPPPPP